MEYVKFIFIKNGMKINDYSDIDIKSSIRTKIYKNLTCNKELLPLLNDKTLIIQEGKTLSNVLMSYYLYLKNILNINVCTEYKRMSRNEICNTILINIRTGDIEYINRKDDLRCS